MAEETTDLSSKTATPETEVPKPFTAPAGEITSMGPGAFKVDMSGGKFFFHPADLVREKTYLVPGTDDNKMDKFARKLLSNEETTQIKKSFEDLRAETVRTGSQLLTALVNQPSYKIVVQGESYDPNNMTNTSGIGSILEKGTPQQLAALALAQNLLNYTGRVSVISETLVGGTKQTTTRLTDLEHEGRVLCVIDKTLPAGGDLVNFEKVIKWTDEIT